MVDHLGGILRLDLERHKQQLQAVLAQLWKQPVAPHVLQDGLMNAHTLKALAAASAAPHLENYATQLEQVFILAQGLPQDQWQQKLYPHLKTIEREFEAACRWVEAERINTQKPPSILTHLVNQLRKQQTQQARQQEAAVRQTKHPQQHILISDLFRAFQPWVAQAAQAQGQPIDLLITVPKPFTVTQPVLDLLQTILVHLLRNAVFHGIESSAERVALGKSATGRIELFAECEEQTVVLAVSDDGVGILHPQKTPLFTEAQTHSPMVSGSAITASSIYTVQTQQTGLGVGLPIVKQCVEKLGGQWTLNAIPHQGTAVTIRFPIQNLYKNALEIAALETEK